MWYHMEFNGIDPESQKPKLIDTDEKFSQEVSIHLSCIYIPCVIHRVYWRVSAYVCVCILLGLCTVEPVYRPLSCAITRLEQSFS